MSEVDPTQFIAGNGDGPSILIVDDHSLLSGSLAMVLTAEGCSVRTMKTSGVDSLVAELNLKTPQMVLVRLQPGPRLKDGLELVAAASASGAAVAVLSESSHDLLLAVAAEAGAVGLLSTGDLLVDTVDQVLAMTKGEQVLSPDRKVALIKQLEEHRSDRDGRFLPFESLSRREGEVLCLLMEGYSVNKIAESSFVSIGTVRTQVKAILRKLGVSSQAAAVALAYRSGWPAVDQSLPVDLRLTQP